MAAPGMALVPMAMNFFEKKYPKIKTSIPLTLGIQLVLVGTCLVFATPMCCAIFPQKSAYKVGNLESELKEKLVKDGYAENDYVYYNKGLWNSQKPVLVNFIFCVRIQIILWNRIKSFDLINHFITKFTFCNFLNNI